MAGEGDGVSISRSRCAILVILTSQCITAVLQLLPAPGHPPAHVPVWDTLVRTGEVGMAAKMFTVNVGVVAAGVAEFMYTSHYISSTLSIIPIRDALSVLCHYTGTISPTLAGLCGHAALMLSIFSPEVYCCVAALTISINALVPTSNIPVTI